MEYLIALSRGKSKSRLNDTFSSLAAAMLSHVPALVDNLLRVIYSFLLMHRNVRLHMDS